jgi:hypothetical protein
VPSKIGIEIYFIMRAYYFIIFTIKKYQNMSYTDKMLRDDALKGKVIVVTGGGSRKAMTKYFWN